MLNYMAVRLKVEFSSKCIVAQNGGYRRSIFHGAVVDEYVCCGDVIGVGSGDGEVVGVFPPISPLHTRHGELHPANGQHLVTRIEVVGADESPL